jgi:hypothetical protein
VGDGFPISRDGFDWVYILATVKKREDSPALVPLPLLFGGVIALLGGVALLVIVNTRFALKILSVFRLLRGYCEGILI